MHLPFLLDPSFFPKMDGLASSGHISLGMRAGPSPEAGHSPESPSLLLGPSCHLIHSMGMSRSFYGGTEQIKLSSLRSQKDIAEVEIKMEMLFLYQDS